MSLASRRRALLMGQRSDYIRDGLVMWLDGEKNGDDGSHDPSPTVWYDQSGNNYNWALTGVTVNDKSVGFSSSGESNATRTYAEGSVSYTYAEVVFKKTESISTTDAILVGYGNNFGSLFTKSSSIGVSSKTVRIPALNKVFAFTTNCYLNGKQATNTNVAASFASNVDPTIGRYNGNNKLNGDIYCIRLYNRILSAAEIAHNFEIDKKRFGIED